MELIDKLINKGINLNVKVSEGKTLLNIATELKNIQLVRKLLENGADPNLVDQDGWNALDLAIIQINYKAAYFLVTETELKCKTFSEY